MSQQLIGKTVKVQVLDKVREGTVRSTWSSDRFIVIVPLRDVPEILSLYLICQGPEEPFKIITCLYAVAALELTDDQGL